jgi:opacity protein-like surface antigen
MGEVGSGPPTIACHYSWNNNWAPRIGATYDIKGDGRSKIFGSYGRFYVKVPNDMAARGLAADAGVTRADYFDQGLTRPIPQGVVAGTPSTTNHLTLAGLHASVFANDVRSTYSDEWLGGVEFEVARNVSLGVRYIRRKIPVVMEDYAPAQVLLYADAGSIEYIIDNITNSTATLDPRDFGHSYAQAHFEDPTHKYQAIEATINKAFSDNWSLMASYRWSKLDGNYEGFFRSDNGQADPGITSLFDFPTNDPSYREVGAVCCGYRGDIRYQGTTLGSGRLPNDRPHQFKMYANYTFGSLNAGMGLNIGSGRSLTALAANPGYTNSGEIPETLRGEGFETVDGFKARTDTELYFDAHLDYTIKFGSQRIILLADAFNLFDTQKPLDYDNYSEITFGDLNPDFGTAKQGGGFLSQYHAPRQIRLGARFEW